jgi:phospholipid-binding lipoprotein MlaA
MRVRHLPLILSGLVAAGLAISGCAAPGASGGAPGSQTASADEGFNDPFEDTNRGVFGFNKAVDDTVLVPVSKAYRTVVPPPMRQSMHDFMQNLNGPVIFMNDMLQGEVGLAAKTFARLAINTTVGVGGMFDVATRVVGIPYHSNDLGITLAVWGFAAGPYVIIPVLGPSNPRDIVGQIGDGFADPGNYVAGQHHLLWAVMTRSLTSGIDHRSRNIETLADIERTALDNYATIRSLYRQRREAEIRHENSNLPNPGFGGDSGPEPAINYSVAK